MWLETQSGSSPLSYRMDRMNLPVIWFILIFYIITSIPEVSLQGVSVCGEDWIKNGEYCYFVSNQNREYINANKDCVKLGSTLTSIYTAEENTFIYGLTKGSSVWIGYDDIHKEDTFSWIDGSSVKYESWDKDPNNQPDNHQNEDCVEMQHEDGNWNDLRCDEKLRYICRTQVTGCKQDWKQDGDYCYYVSDTKRQYDDANTDCVSKGSTLTSIHSDEENTFITGIVMDTSWIGLNDREEENSFTWIDESALTYAKWDSSEPNNGVGWGSNEDCVEIYHDSGEWNDEDCDADRKYICRERAIPPITTPPPTTQITTTDLIPPTTQIATTDLIPPTTTYIYLPTTYQSNLTSLTDVTPSTSANPRSTSVSVGSPEPQIGGPSTAVIVGSIVGALLALLVAVLLMCALIRRKRRNGKSDKPHNLTERKPLEFDGPYDMTIEGEVKQPIYTNTCQPDGVSSEKQPVYANTNPADPSSEEVYQEVTETSRDEDIVTVYSTVDSKDNLINSDTNKHLSVVYAKVDKDMDPIFTKDPLDNNDKGEEEGWEVNVAYSGFQDENYAKVNDNDKEGWEDNALYGTGDMGDDKDKLNEKDTEGWKENDLYDEEQTQTTEEDTEGWEDNVLYGDAGAMDKDTEGWEENALYGDAAGSSDDEVNDGKIMSSMRGQMRRSKMKTLN